MTDILTDVNFAEHNSVPVPANAGKTAALADPSFNTSSESVGQASTVSTVVHAQEPMSTAASQRNSVVTLASPSGSRTRKLTTSQIWPQAREQNEKAVAFVARLQVYANVVLV